MNGWVVADSGVFIATVLNETYTSHAEQLIGTWQMQGLEIAAPALFRYEIVAVMRKSMFRGIISAEQAAKDRDKLLEFPIQHFVDNALLKRGFDLASQFNRPTAYDAQYLAVAERVNGEFWTTDERLFNAIKEALPWVKWLGALQQY